MGRPIEPYELDDPKHGADVLDVAIMAARKQLEYLCVAAPAFIMKYDRQTQKVTAQPVLRRRRNGRWIRRAPVVQTPVLFPAGGGFAQIWDLQPGDFGFLLHTDDPQTWLHGGGKDAQGKFYNRNDLNYTFFLDEDDARVGLRVRRGEEGGVELAREKEGEPKRRGGTREGKIVIGDDVNDLIETVKRALKAI